VIFVDTSFWVALRSRRAVNDGREVVALSKTG
jgi:predicted nucleic acid-binding protein